MRMIGAACLVAIGGMLVCTPAQAQFVRSFQGNDTGGIISASAASQNDVRAMATTHCARYGKVVKFTGVDPEYGGYFSFACRWLPYGANGAPLHTYY